jgi:hypothetical protein
MRLVEHRDPVARRRVRSLKILETLLGDEQNLFVLGDHLLGAPNRFGGVSHVAVVIGCIEIDRRRLQRSALRLGRRLFGCPIPDFERQVTRWLR